jgi:hypothetical protein
MWDGLESAGMDGKRAALALMASALVACGGTAPATSSATATSASSVAATSPAATAATRPTGTSLALGTANQPTLSDLLNAAPLSQYKVTYRYTVTGADTTEQTWYSKPPRSRFDFTTGTGTQRMTISTYNLPEGTFFCFGVAPTIQCVGASGVGSPLDSNLAFVVQRALVQNPAQFGGTFQEARTIAGQPGFCYQVTSGVGAAFQSGTFCYTREGLSLFQQFTSQGSSVTMEATQASLTVPDSDFTLPTRP